MAPHNVVIVAVDDVNPDAALARKAAESLKLPDRKPKEVVEDLLARLSDVRRRRELRGLNHWEDFAPSYLERLVLRHERLRVSMIEAFFREAKSKALARAQSMLGDRQEAEDAVGEAFLKLLAGKAGPEHFYRVLWRVCMDRIRSRQSAGKVLVRRWDVPVHGEEGLIQEPACAKIGGGDPLEILIRQEEIREGIQRIKTRRKHRQTKDLAWWKELLSHHCPEEVVGKQPAHPHM